MEPQAHLVLWDKDYARLPQVPKSPPPEGAAPEKAWTVLHGAVRAVGVPAWRGRLVELCRVWDVREGAWGALEVTPMPRLKGSPGIGMGWAEAQGSARDTAWGTVEQVSARWAVQQGEAQVLVG